MRERRTNHHEPGKRDELALTRVRAGQFVTWSDADKAAILGGNAARVYRLG